MAAREWKQRSERPVKPALDALSFPEDVSGNSVRVILLGGRRALIENHLGVAEVGRETVSLATRAGLMSIQGLNLRLTDVRTGALAVEGQIRSVVLPLAGEEADGHA